jgi:hypothetical protein
MRGARLLAAAGRVLLRDGPGRLTSRAVTVAGWPCGPRSKYLVVAFWLGLVALMGPLASRLQGAESNDPSA